MARPRFSASEIVSLTTLGGVVAALLACIGYWVFTGFDTAAGAGNLVIGAILISRLGGGFWGVVLGVVLALIVGLTRRVRSS